VYRSVDNSVPPVLGNPCSIEECHSPPSNSSQSPVNPRLVGTAIAGPLSPAKVVYACSMYVCNMSKEKMLFKSSHDKALLFVCVDILYCVQAKDFRKRWRSPSKPLDSIKKSDADKGLERVGR